MAEIVQIFTNEDDDAYVQFRYNEAIIAIVKRMPKRWWDKPNRVWWFRAEDARTLATVLYRAGYVVFLDEAEFRPPVISYNGSGGSLLVSYFQSLPEELRKPLYRAMSKVLHPDMGGDTELMKQLNAAIEAFP